MTEIKCKNIKDDKEYICYQFIMGADARAYAVCTKDNEFTLIPLEDLVIARKKLNESKEH